MIIKKSIIKYCFAIKQNIFYDWWFAAVSLRAMAGFLSPENNGVSTPEFHSKRCYCNILADLDNHKGNEYLKEEGVRHLLVNLKVYTGFE